MLPFFLVVAPELLMPGLLPPGAPPPGPVRSPSAIRPLYDPLLTVCLPLDEFRAAELCSAASSYWVVCSFGLEPPPPMDPPTDCLPVFGKGYLITHPMLSWKGVVCLVITLDRLGWFLSNI